MRLGQQAAFQPSHAAFQHRRLGVLTAESVQAVGCEFVGFSTAGIAHRLHQISLCGTRHLQYEGAGAFK